MNSVWDIKGKPVSSMMVGIPAPKFNGGHPVV